MAYVINRYNGEPLVVLEDATLDNTTSINLIGRNYTGYGEMQNENFVFLLENFSNETSPLRPVSGQLWYNSSSKTLNIYDGTTWKSASSADVGPEAPLSAEGALWYKTTTDQLFVYYNSQWNLIGPQNLEGFGVTRVESVQVYDSSQLPHAVLLYKVDGEVIAITSKNSFVLHQTLNNISGFTTINKGTTYSNTVSVTGNLIGNADSATRLKNSIKINNVYFDGQSNITVKADTNNELIQGDYITGGNFDGSAARRWSVEATPNNTIGKIVARDSQGNFEANIITASFAGTLTGNVQSTSGESYFDIVRANTFIGTNFSGNAYSSTKLQTARLINGVSFNGTSDITITAAAGTLTGPTLNSSVTESSLTSVGTLLSLDVAGSVTAVEDRLHLYKGSDNATVIETNAEEGLELKIYDVSKPASFASLKLLSAEATGTTSPALVPALGQTFNIGTLDTRFTNVYCSNADISTVTVSRITNTGAVTLGSDVVIEGDLTIQGSLTTLNSTEVEIRDINLTLAAGAATPTAANGAGITIDGAGATLTYTVDGNKWNINRPLDAGDNDFITSGLFQGTATSARYADLAEKYVADAEYEPGTVLHFGGTFEVSICTDDMCRRVAGIVSTNPAYLMNSECTAQFAVSVALQGRVPCKVKGLITKGDMLVSAGDGYARSEKNPVLGSVLGKALEDFDGDTGVIEVVVGRL